MTWWQRLRELDRRGAQQVREEAARETGSRWWVYGLLAIGMTVSTALFLLVAQWAVAALTGGTSLYLLAEAGHLRRIRRGPRDAA